ncbi:MAG: hypothetical protein LBH25_09920 [Fibromonadaceae bacterium]|jgi:hypothetical protein|nr:hypothetical protein [Fibromonadaceae bacterium]
MYKIIQNYSILVFPVLAGFVTLFAVRELEFNQDKSHIAIWIIIGTILIIAPMLKLSREKELATRLMLGVIAIIIFYIPICIFTGTTGSGFHTHGSLIENFMMALVYMYFHLSHMSDFLFFNIMVLIAFALNDIYARKIGKILHTC